MGYLLINSTLASRINLKLKMFSLRSKLTTIVLQAGM